MSQRLEGLLFLGRWAEDWQTQVLCSRKRVQSANAIIYALSVLISHFLCINKAQLTSEELSTRKQGLFTGHPILFDYVYRNRDEEGSILDEVVTLDEIETDEFVYDLEILACRLFTGL